MIADHEQAHDAMLAAFRDVKDGVSVGALVLMRDLFGAMANVYTLELMSCTAEDLPKKQAAAKQCLALQRAMNPDGEVPKI